MKEKEIIEFFAKEPSLERLKVQNKDCCLALQKKIGWGLAVIVRSPCIGWVKTYIKEQQKVHKEDILGEIVMAGIPHEIVAPVSGKIVKRYRLKRHAVDDFSQKAAEHDQPLFEIRPTL